MSGKLPSSTDPVVLALCLDWLHDTLPWPRAPRGDWQAAGGSGFSVPRGARSKRTWRPCEQCNGKGETRRGPCANCDGGGGWHFDPMDEKRAPLLTDEDAHPQPDRPRVRFVRLSADLEPEQLAAAGANEQLSRPLLQLTVALAELRRRDRYQRAMLQRVHILRLERAVSLRPAERETYHAALVHLGEVMPPKFRAPRHLREKAASSDEKGSRSPSEGFQG